MENNQEVLIIIKLWARSETRSLAENVKID